MLSTIPKTQKLFVMIGVMLAMLLSALDQTIVATAMPRIVRDLHGLAHLSWVFTAYLLASTIVVPIYGKLSDIYGRKPFILSAIIIFLIGSILSGLSQNMLQLILFRGLQGLGGGAIMANAFATIGDLFAPAERGKWQGVFGGVFGLSSVVGPTLGGWLTDHASWRWNFFINIPVGILAFCVIWFLMPKIASHLKDKTIDYLGSFFLTVSLITLLLGLVWGGSLYAWGSPQIIILLTTAFICTIIFGIVESKVKQPILPLDLFKNPIFSVSSLIIFLTAVGMFGSILYVPLFAQLVLGISATNSGTILTPLTLSLVFASIFSGQIVSRTGRYKWLSIFGLGLVSISIYLLSQMNAQTTQAELVLRMIITGVGLGITLPIFTLTVQNAFPYSRLGVATASVQLFRSIGGTVGTAVLGGVLNNGLTNKLGSGININNLQNLLIGANKQHIVKIKGAFAGSITEVFFITSIIVAFAFVAGFFLKEIPLRKSHAEGAEVAGKELAMEEGVFPPKSEVKI